MTAPRAALFADSASRSSVATSVKTHQLWTSRNPSIVTVWTASVANWMFRGPCRSARSPAGIPASSPTSPASVSPAPTAAAEMPDDEREVEH